MILTTLEIEGPFACKVSSPVRHERDPENLLETLHLASSCDSAEVFTS